MRSPASLSASSIGDVRDVLRAIARPRRVGSPAAAEVGDELTERMTALGYRVTAVPFSFSSWPGRFAVPVAGAVHLAGTYIAGTLLRGSHAAIALVVILLMAAADLALFGYAPLAMQKLGVGRVEGECLIASRRGARPRWLIMAHRDSKSQPVPTAVRGAALAGALLSWVVLGALALVALLAPVPWPLVAVAGAIGVVSGGILLFSWVGDSSPGALDNASGVAALVGLAARQDAEADDVAFVITDGEELGLCGARCLATRLPPVAGVINLDGIDDDGPYHIVERFGRPRRGLAPHLAAALMRAAAESGRPLVRRDVPFGLMVDHMPLVDAGIPALTLMRGRLRSLLRVHTPADDLSHLDGSGAEDAVELLARALDHLRAAEPVAPGAVRG